MTEYFGKTTTETNTTGAIAHSHELATSNWTLTLHLNTAPTTSGSFTVTLDAINGAAYDTLLYTRDLAAAPAITDIKLTGGVDDTFTAGDIIRVAYANADNRTYALQVTSGKVN